MRLKSGIEAITEAFRDLARRPKGNLPVLDALRSLAILLVVCGHFAEEFERVAGRSALGGLPLFRFGWTGVDLFFVLSGFLIGRQLWKELERTGTISVAAFVVRRGVRIWPLYFATLAFLAIALGKAQGDLSRVLPDLLMVSNYAQGIVSGGWSLSTEEQFYVVVPALLLLAHRFLPLRRQYALPVGLLVLAPVVRYAEMSDWTTGALVKASSDVYTAIHTHCDGLVAGLVLAWISVARPAALAPQGSLLRNALAPVGVAALGIALRKASADLFAFTSLACLYGAMALYLLRDRSWVSRACSFWPFYLVSRLSYGMYLNHFEILPRLVPWLNRATEGLVGDPSARFALALAISTSASVLVALATFALIEYPFLRARERILSRLRGGRPSLSPIRAGEAAT